MNTATAILYARQLLTSLLADWPESGHMITAQLLGCQSNTHVPYVLDLLNKIETKESFQKVRTNVSNRGDNFEAVIFVLISYC